MSYWIVSEAELARTVRYIVGHMDVVDMHTHLYAPAFGDMLLRGFDELLTYHYLIADFMSVSTWTAPEFFALDKQRQADHIWSELFLQRTPFNEASRGVVTTLREMGLDPASRDIASYRSWYASMTPEAAVDTTFRIAGISDVVMTNDPLDMQERAVWLQIEKGLVKKDPRFHAALRIDQLLLDWDQTRRQMAELGFDVDSRPQSADNALADHTLSEVKRFLVESARRIDALYMAVSLPPDFAYPRDDIVTTLIDGAVLPTCRELGIPFALMMGVRRQVNPDLYQAGDASGVVDLRSLARLCASHPANRFFVTALARENQHELAVLSRKFPNLMLFGCWWFLNNPSLIAEMTRMRCELLGLSFIPQHSDARVLEQLIYKWKHSRAILTDVLYEQYARVLAAGWRIAADEVERDVRTLLKDNFWKFIRRK